MAEAADPVAGLHGTYAGRVAHQRFRTPPCRACKKAAAEYKRAWNRRNRCAPGLGWPLAAVLLAVLLTACGVQGHPQPVPRAGTVAVAP